MKHHLIKLKLESMFNQSQRESLNSDECELQLRYLCCNVGVNKLGYIYCSINLPKDCRILEVISKAIRIQSRKVFSFQRCPAHTNTPKDFLGKKEKKSKFASKAVLGQEMWSSCTFVKTY